MKLRPLLIALGIAIAVLLIRGGAETYSRRKIDCTVLGDLNEFSQNGVFAGGRCSGRFVTSWNIFGINKERFVRCRVVERDGRYFQVTAVLADGRRFYVFGDSSMYTKNWYAGILLVREPSDGDTLRQLTKPAEGRGPTPAEPEK